MLFTTFTFLIFVAIVFVTYWWLVERRAQNLLIVAASYVFYGWWDWRFCLMMAASTCVDYVVARKLGVAAGVRRRHVLLGLSITFNLGLLGVFKYFNFFAASLTSFLGALGWEAHPTTLKIILPVGISFYTFQTLSYTIDVYRKQLSPAHSLVEYLAFVSFFPQLVAGPIERATHLLPQFQRARVFDERAAGDGCRQILWGFFKKLALADQLATYVDAAYSDPGASSGAFLGIATVFFAFQIYCDFSAYSDIAVGTARLFGFELMRNFAYPYFSQDVGEFWRRWHISLSTWFRDYLFVPLGGSRAGRWKTSTNLLVTFAVSGLWHGAAWQFLAWGTLNGIALLPGVLGGATAKRRATDVPGSTRMLPTAGELLKIVRTFAFICVTWVFFRADSIQSAWLILTKIAAAPLDPHVGAIGFGRTAELTGWLLLLVSIEWLQRRHPHPLQFGQLPRLGRWVAYTTLLWGMFILMPDAVTPFLYFQF